MQSFIVLGIIPGTNIQTNLNFWLTISSIVLLLVLRTRIIALRNYAQRVLLAHQIARTINHFELITI